MGSMLFNDYTGTWEPELCALAGLSVDMLPEIREPGDIAGCIGRSAAADTGLREGTPVLVGTTDTAPGGLRLRSRISRLRHGKARHRRAHMRHNRRAGQKPPVL